MATKEGSSEKKYDNEEEAPPAAGDSSKVGKKQVPEQDVFHMFLVFRCLLALNYVLYRFHYRVKKEENILVVLSPSTLTTLPAKFARRRR